MGSMERGQGEGGWEVWRGGPLSGGRDRGSIEDSAGRQRILKRRGPGKGRSSR